MPVTDRELPGPEAHALLGLAREIATTELRRRVTGYERDGVFPREVFALLGHSGLLSLPFPERFGGGDQPYQVYLQVLEELAGAWLAVALGVSVHTLSCLPVAEHGTGPQRERWLPEMLGGDTLGAYCLSEPESGSDAASLRTRARREGDAYVVDGTKAWTTHGGVADFYTVMARTAGEGAHGISCLHVPAGVAGLRAGKPERKMGMGSSPTTQLAFEDVRVPAANLVGTEGEGFAIAMSALDAGRLGIAACAVGLAQAALDHAVAYANDREQFGRPIIAFEGLAFLLADMATQVAAARALYLAAARARDAGKPYRTAAAHAKVFCTDVAMRVTTDAVQVLGGAGYVADHPVERWMREAKVLQIVEGTNQIQRLVISRSLTRPSPDAVT